MQHRHLQVWLTLCAQYPRVAPRGWTRSFKAGDLLSIIVPVPKKDNISSLSDYQTVALTWVMKKSFEPLLLSLKHTKQNKLTNKNKTQAQSGFIAVCLQDQLFSGGCNQNGSSNRFLTIWTILVSMSESFLWTYKTIIPERLHAMLFQLDVPPDIFQWITNLMIDRRQYMWIGFILLELLSVNTGASQGCLLFPSLCLLNTMYCIFVHPLVKLLNFADDTTVVGLKGNDRSASDRKEA